jgi:hypothetical protein
MGQTIQTNVDGVSVDRGFLAHFQVAATVAATAVVAAASAATDYLTITGTAALGARVNALSVLLTTAEDDSLAVTGDDDTGIITISLANTTATKNTAALIQTAIRALTTVAGVDVSSFTCTAAGNWDTAAIATGETAAVDFTGGVSDAEAADTDGVHAAITCTTPEVAATCVVEAASAETDILTTTAGAGIGADANDLSILLATAENDTLAVSGSDTTGVITIALADTTATKNTAALIQAAIRALEEVAGVDVSEFTCAAGGNWDTAAIATGETGAVDFTGGVTAVADVATTNITNPAVPRNVTATAGGTAADIGAIKVTITGTNYADEEISEELPVFTVNTAGTVTGSKAFKTITQISVPAHDGTGATTAIGFGDKLGLPFKLSHNTVIPGMTFLDNTVESTDPTVAVDADAVQGNTIDLNSALDGSVVDVYLIV